MSERKINVVYLAGGYPTPDNPSHGIFNQRAAMALKEHVNLTVIQYRIYKPGRKFLEKINEDGFTRLIICVPYSPVLESKLYYFNNRMFYFFTLLFARQVLKEADIVHASDANLAVFGVWLKRKFRFRLLAQCIGGDLNQDLAKFYREKWMRNWVKALDAVSFNSVAMESRFHEMFGKHQLEKVIYRGVDSNKFFPPRDKVEGTRFYFLGGLPNYGTFTHGRNTKGGMNLMKAWSRLDEEINDADVSLAFAGPDADISLVKEWQRTLKHPGRVNISGKIDPASVADFHRKGNVALIPSLEEGLPNVAMEAAATGNLVIANPVGGIPEVVQDGVTGIFCETPDAEGLYKKMNWAIRHPDQRAVMGNEASEKIKNDFSSSDFGKKYTAYYHEILKQ